MTKRDKIKTQLIDIVFDDLLTDFPSFEYEYNCIYTKSWTFFFLFFFLIKRYTFALQLQRLVVAVVIFSPLKFHSQLVLSLYLYSKCVRCINMNNSQQQLSFHVIYCECLYVFYFVFSFLFWICCRHRHNFVFFSS